jgi:hypothetical protein
MPIDMSNSIKILNEIQKELETKDKVQEIVEESLTNEDLKDTLKILEVVEEATTAGMQMRSYESKKNAAIGAIAVSLAKKNRDPLYDRLKHFRGAWKHAKNEILQRYYSQATQKWQAGQN